VRSAHEFERSITGPKRRGPQDQWSTLPALTFAFEKHGSAIRFLTLFCSRSCTGALEGVYIRSIDVNHYNPKRSRSDRDQKRRPYGSVTVCYSAWKR
jgi:hypothetical protein